MSWKRSTKLIACLCYLPRKTIQILQLQRLNLSTETLVGLVKYCSLLLVCNLCCLYLWGFWTLQWGFFFFLCSFFFILRRELLNWNLVLWGVKTALQKWQETQLWIQQRRGSMSLVTSKNWEEKWYFILLFLFFIFAILCLMELILDPSFVLVKYGLLFNLWCRLCSKLWRYHFPQWPFSLELHLSMVLVFNMQALQLLSGGG